MNNGSCTTYDNRKRWTQENRPSQEILSRAKVDSDKATGGPGQAEAEAEAEAETEAEAAEALPSQEDLMKMIKTLVHPSIRAMRAADASQRLQRERDNDAHAAQEAAQLRSQRDTSQHLQDDIQHLINAYDVPEKPRKPVKRKSKEAVNEDDIPLPDAFQEWERQKTLIHKYFSFNNPTCKPDAKTQRKKPGPKNRTTNAVSKKNDSSNNKIDLMTISDDEDMSRNCVSLADGKSTNNAKRPREDSDNTNKRAKITEDQANDTSAENNKDNTNTDSDDDGDRMIIDEGIRDIDDPLTTPNTQQAQPNNPRLTIMPVDSVPGLDSDHDMPSNFVYVVKTHKKVNVPKNAEVIPTSSTGNSVKLPGDASLTLNTPVTTSINTKLPTYYFIASGKQVKRDSEFKVVSGPSLQTILPKTTPASSQKVKGNSEFKVVSGPSLRRILPKITPASSQNVNNTSESIQMIAKPKFTYPTNIVTMTHPGPLSAKHRIGTEISKALLGQVSKFNPDGSFDPILQSKIVEEIDLTDEPEVDDTTGPKIVSVTSLKPIENENVVANPSTDSNSNKDVKIFDDLIDPINSQTLKLKLGPDTTDTTSINNNINDDLIDPTKLSITSVGNPQKQNLKVGPVKSSINKRVYSNMRILTVTPLTPQSNDNNNQSSVKLTFSLNRNSLSNKSKDVAQTICLDSEASDENETLDCTSIKREVDVDASSNDSESRDVDVESNADIHEANPSIDEVLSIVKTEKESSRNSSQDQATGSRTTSQNKNTSKSLLKPIAQNENSSRSLLKKTFQNQDLSKSLLKKTFQNPESSKGIPKTTSQNLETSNYLLKATPQNQVPNATPQTKDTDNIPIKITSTTTSKDLLELSPEELARLLEDDNDEESIEYAPVPQNNVTTQNIAPIQIKTEKRWAEEIQLSKEKETSTKGVVVKQEPGSEKKNLELLLQDVPSVRELKTALPDVICDDVDPNDEEEAPYFSSIADLGKRQINIEDYVAKVTDPEEPILKFDFSEPVWILAGKYLLLTDENIPYCSPTYLTSARSGDVAPYCEIRFPENVRNKQILNLGTKKGRDVMVCGCAGAGQCMLCQSIAGEGGKAAEFEIYKPTFKKLCRACGVDPKRERARIYNIKQRPYRKIGDKPLKYVVLDARRKCKVCKDDAQYVAQPDTLVINDKYYEKMRDEPLMYAPVLSVVQSAARCVSLVRRGAELYVLNARTASRRRVLYNADAAYASLNAAVRAVMNKLERDEVDATYRRRMDRDQR